MISKAVGRYLRVSPRKAREVITLIKGKHVNDARDILNNTNKRSALFLMKLLNSAIANAKRIPNTSEEDLYISDLYADGGPALKRFKAQAMGRASMIKRRTSHITVKLDLKEEKVPSGQVKKDAGARRVKAGTGNKKSLTALTKKRSKDSSAKKEIAKE